MRRARSTPQAVGLTGGAGWRIASIRGHRRGGERGSVLVEFALILPIFAVMLFGMIQFGLVLAGWAAVRNAVQTSARMIAIGDIAGQTCRGAPSGVTGLTANAYCTVVNEIGTPVGTAVTSTNVPEVGLLVKNGVIAVCAQVPAQNFTGLFNLGLSTSSNFYIEDSSINTSVQDYNPPNGLSSCNP